MIKKIISNKREWNLITKHIKINSILFEFEFLKLFHKNIKMFFLSSEFYHVIFCFEIDKNTLIGTRYGGFIKIRNNNSINEYSEIEKCSLKKKIKIDEQNIKNEIINFLKKLKIKKIYIRQNPFLDYVKIGSYLKKRNENIIYIDLKQNLTNITNNFTKSCKKCIKKSNCQNLKIEFENNKKSSHLATHTIPQHKGYGFTDSTSKQIFKIKNSSLRTGCSISQQNHAQNVVFNKFYPKLFCDFFNKNTTNKNLKLNCDFLENLKKICKDRLISIKVRDEHDEILSYSLILLDNKNAFMLYGSTSKKGKNMFSKYKLIYELIKFLKSKKYIKLILGTGINEKDSIFKFKSSFSKKYLKTLIYEGEINE